MTFTNLENKTGETTEELKNIYLSAIDTLISFGATKEEAKKIVQETFKENVKEC
jgi:hypothetical protein